MNSRSSALLQLLQQDINQHTNDDSQSKQLQNVYENCGFLITVWYNYFDRVVSISTNTAFSVSKNIIITATTNIYSESLNRFADKFYYFPNIDYLTRYCPKIYTSDPTELDPFFASINPGSTIIKANLKSTLLNLSLLVLDEELQHYNFLKIGNMPSSSFDQMNNVQLIGYLNVQEVAIKGFDKNNIVGRRAEAICEIVKIEDNTIQYTFGGALGMAGCPILSRDSKGQYYAIGINTNYYPTRTTCQGIYFSNEVIETVRNLEEALLQPYQSAPSIKTDKDCLKIDQTFKQNTNDNEQNISDSSSNNSKMDVFEMLEYFTIEGQKKLQDY